MDKPIEEEVGENLKLNICCLKTSREVKYNADP